MENYERNTKGSVTETIKELEESFSNKRVQVKSDLEEQGIDNLIPILKRYYPIKMRIHGTDLGDEVNLSISTKYFKRKGIVINKNVLVPTVCSLMEHILINFVYYKAANENIEILNAFMDQFNTDERRITYAIDKKGFPIASIANDHVTFAIDPVYALNIGSMMLASKVTQGEEFPEILNIELDGEIQDIQKFYTAEDIFKAAKANNRINALLGIRVLHYPATIIKKVYYRKTEKRPKGYVENNGKYTVYDENDNVILEYTLSESEKNRKRK